MPPNVDRVCILGPPKRKEPRNCEALSIRRACAYAAVTLQVTVVFVGYPVPLLLPQE